MLADSQRERQFKKSGQTSAHAAPDILMTAMAALPGAEESAKMVGSIHPAVVLPILRWNGLNPEPNQGLPRYSSKCLVDAGEDLT